MNTYTKIQSARFLLCILLTCLFMLHTTHWINIPSLQRIENITYDFRLKSTALNTVDPRIVIVDIDEKSLASEGRWPWSRNKLSELVDILFEHYQIKLLAFDITFPEKDRSSGLQHFENLAKNTLKNNKDYLAALKKIRPQLSYDNLFAKSLAHRNIVLGYFTSFQKHPIQSHTALPNSIGNVEQYQFTHSLIHANSYSANLAILQTAAQAGGFFNNPLVDEDGSYRRLPLLIVYDNQLYDALSLAVVRALFPNQKITFHTYNYGGHSVRLESIQLGSLTIPVNEQSALLVPYRGQQGRFQYISATDILSFQAKKTSLQNKIVIFGSSAAGIFDLRSTPIQKNFPGVEIHANIISGLLEQCIKYRPSYIAGLEFIFIGLLAFIGIFIFKNLTAGKLSAFFISIVIFTASINYLLWQYYNIDMILAIPILFISLLFTLQITFNYLSETYNKNYLTKLFGQYIPAELVSEMIRSKQSFSMQAKSQELTVLFTDVRGFTSISESFEPNELAELINNILSPITQLIHNNNGTIDKYMGDAVMAFWGAPKENKQHASDAIKTALAITPEIHKVENEFVARGWPPIKLGVGINTGTMCVGNMGSKFRVAYTVLGDAVNLGSRLEGLTKQYGVNIIVSESTKNAAPEFIYKQLDNVRVKGKQKPIRIYEPMGYAEQISQQEKDLLRLHQQALDDYLAQNWTAAKQAFLTLQQLQPECFINKVYLQRIDTFIHQAPGTNWDGCFTHTSK